MTERRYSASAASACQVRDSKRESRALQLEGKSLLRCLGVQRHRAELVHNFFRSLPHAPGALVVEVALRLGRLS